MSHWPQFALLALIAFNVASDLIKEGVLHGSGKQSGVSTFVGVFVYLAMNSAFLYVLIAAGSFDVWGWR